MENIASKFGPWGLLILLAWRFATQLQSAIERIAIVGEAVAVKLGAEVPAAATAKRAWFFPAALLLAGATVLGGCSTAQGVGTACTKFGKGAVCGVVGIVNDVGAALCGDEAAPAPAPAPAPEPAPEAKPTGGHNEPPPAAPPCGERGCAIPSGDARAYLAPRR